MGTLRDLQFALQLKIEELRQRDALIDELELELDAKDDLIRRLQGELDRMRITHGTPSSTSGPHHVSSLKAKRRTVITEPVNVDPKAILQNPSMSHAKSQESQRVIEEALSQNDWLKYLRRDLSPVVDCAYPTMVAQGVRITQEADEASRAFVVEEGKLEVSMNGQKLHTIDAGTLFGELALLYNHTCSITVTAMTSCKLWVIDRQAFQRTMQRSSLLRINQSLDLLHSVPLLSVLPEDILIKISDVLQEYHYSDGDYIIKHGSPGDTLFIINRGQVKVLDRRSVSEDSVSVSVLFQGDCFGEKALNGEAARYLSAVAVGDVTCLLVDRQTVRRFIGPFEDTKKNCTNDPKTKNEAGDSVLGDVSFKDVQVLCNVGEGRFGHTQLVHVRNDSSQVFVLKVIQKHTLLSSGHRERILSEKQILMDACCPFIVRLFHTFRDVKCLYMLMEACLGGDLWTLLRERGSFDEKEVHFYTACVLEALSFLHDRGVVHRDLKPENVLLDVRGYAKLTGFGSAKQLGSLQRSWSFCGSAGYQAPEIILHKGHGVMADYWALGVFIYELLDGSPPFIDPDQTKTFAAVLKGTEACEFPNTISSLAVDIIKQLCRENPTDRLGQRNGVKDIRQHEWFEGFDWDGLYNSSLAAPALPNVQMGHTVLVGSHNEPDTDLSAVGSDWDKDF